MSFTAEWTPTTGFDTTGYTVKFGKQLNQCTVDEITAHPICGSNHPLANCAYIAKDSDLGYSSVAMHLANAQFKEPILNGKSNTWICSPAPTGDNALVYRRTIFVGMPSTVTVPQYCLTDECDNRILIIEDIKSPNKLVYNYGNINWAVGGAASFRTMALQIKHTCNRGQSAWSSAPSTVTYTDTSDPDNPQTTVYKICMYHVYTIGDDCFIVGYDYIGVFGGRYQNASNEYNFLSNGSDYKSFVSDNGNDLFIGLNINNTGGETNLQGILGEDIYPDPVPDPATFDGQRIIYAPANIVLQNARLRFFMSNSTIGGSLRSCILNFDLFDTEEIRKQQFARSGIYFVVNGELFKPIISNGIVTGYGTPEMESEIDDYTDLNHPVPSGGGGGGGGPADDEDNKDPVSTLSAPFATGLAHYYITTAASPVLGQIAEAMSTWDIDASKKDLYRNLISCKLVKPPAPVPSTPGLTFEIYGVAPEYQGAPITITGVAGNPTATFGPYSIPRKFNDFRDYAPYTKCEIHLPYCGWCPLPSHVVGRSVYVKYFTDIIAATCKAVVYCYDNPVAEAAGVIGLDIPFAAENVGAKMEAANAGLLAATAGAVQTALGVGTMVSTKGGSGAKQAAGGLSQYVSGFTQMAMAANENWTEICGKNGDGCCLAGLNEIIIKITRPKFGQWTESPYVPAGYAHNIGYTSMRSVQVGSVTGFLQCDNVDTSGIAGATDRERQLIKNYLESGVIVNHPEE